MYVYSEGVNGMFLIWFNYHSAPHNDYSKLNLLLNQLHVQGNYLLRSIICLED